MNKYLIIGDGRVATHMTHYLGLLNLPTSQWSRRNPSSPLVKMASQAKAILLLISDSAIETFLKEHPYLASTSLKPVMHFSGALTRPDIESAHPLMTFGPELYSFENYKRIPFVTVAGRAALSELIAELPNPHFAIQSEKKKLYHALCSMSGNFSTILWEHVISRFETELGLPRQILMPYLEQCASNVTGSQKSVLTGPLARGDVSLIIQHLDALAGSPDQKLYYAFLNFYLEQKKTIGELNYEHSRI